MFSASTTRLMRVLVVLGCMAAGVAGMLLFLVGLHLAQDHQVLHQLIAIENARAQGLDPYAKPAAAPAPPVEAPPAKK